MILEKILTAFVFIFGCLFLLGWLMLELRRQDIIDKLLTDKKNKQNPFSISLFYGLFKNNE